ncbi:MAG: hypothetical protein HOE53_02775 [Candidatus Magasanikbacteria bacterium]|jgi:hypothetical protein|nr:hypothetical protein [Candidatus Magasanikbacteria bacterium]
MAKITLACTYHDPQGALLARIEEFAGRLKVFFGSAVVVCTPLTKKNVIEALKKAKWNVVIQKENNVGQIYRRAIAEGAKYGKDGLLYIDLDRALHWCASHKKELEAFVKELFVVDWPALPDYIVCERSKRGYAMHQEPLIETERIANRVIAHTLGEDEVHDYLSGAFYYSSEAIAVILGLQSRDDVGIWGQWWSALHKAALPRSYMTFEGLEWETPHQFLALVEAAGGIDHWRDQINNDAHEWRKRVGMAQQIVDGALSEV